MQSRRPLSLPSFLASPHNSKSIEPLPMTVGARSIEFRNETTEDVAAPAENAEALKKEYGNRVTVVDVPGAGHAMLPEQPEFIAKTIIDWLQR
jgi:hypothetical protein